MIGRLAWITAAFLAGGLLLAVGVGAGVDRLVVLPAPLAHVPSGLLALVVLSAAGAGWGRAIGRQLGGSDLRRVAWAGALGYGPSVLLVAIGLTQLERLLVEQRAAHRLPIHVVFAMVFVPAVLLVASLGGIALAIGLRDWMLAWPLGAGTGLSAAAAFFGVDLAMETLGWRVGAPGAAQRATMLTVTLLGCGAAALAAGATIGAVLSRRGPATQL
jgi:hypothetical protein